MSTTDAAELRKAERSTAAQAQPPVNDKEAGVASGAASQAWYAERGPTYPPGRPYAALADAMAYCFQRGATFQRDRQGTVPAGDLPQWREKMEGIFDDLGLPEHTTMRRHLAAMPAQDVNAELLGALRRSLSGHECVERELWSKVPAGPPNHWMIVLHSVVQTMKDDARAAIDQAEQGAAG